MSLNRVIGKNNTIPWHISEDLKHFKQTTRGHTVVLGRKTFESIGKPLPGRTNIVLTRDKNFSADGVTVIHTLDRLSTHTKPDDEIFIIGGADIYKQTLPLTQKIYLTMIEKNFDGDAFFPVFEDEFDVVETSDVHESLDGLKFKFVTFVRKK